MGVQNMINSINLVPTIETVNNYGNNIISNITTNVAERHIAIFTRKFFENKNDAVA